MMASAMNNAAAFVELCQVRTRAWGVLKTGEPVRAHPWTRVKWIRRYEGFGTLHVRVERSPAITSAARVFDILCPQTDYTIV